MKKRIIMIIVVAFGLLAITESAASAGGGNSESAKLCQKDGWQNLFRSDGSAFVDEGACVSYAAHGGTLSTAPPTVDASLAFTQPSTHSFPSPYNTATGDVTVHNGGGLTETVTVTGQASFASGGGGGGAGAFDFNDTYCSHTYVPDTHSFSCTVSLAPGDTVTLLSIGVSGTMTIPGSASITAATYSDPDTSNNTLSFTLAAT
jgi:hypothetical protein